MDCIFFYAHIAGNCVVYINLQCDDIHKTLVFPSMYYVRNYSFSEHVRMYSLMVSQ